MHSVCLPGLSRWVKPGARVLECQRRARQDDLCDEVECFVSGGMPHLILDMEPLKVRDICFVGSFSRLFLKSGAEASPSDGSCHPVCRSCKHGRILLILLAMIYHSRKGPS